MRGSSVAAVFGHDWCACEMAIVCADAIAGYKIVGDAPVDVVDLESILFAMGRRGYAKELKPLVSTPERLDSSRDVFDVRGDEIMG